MRLALDPHIGFEPLPNLPRLLSRPTGLALVSQCLSDPEILLESVADSVKDCLLST